MLPMTTFLTASALGAIHVFLTAAPLFNSVQDESDDAVRKPYVIQIRSNAGDEEFVILADANESDQTSAAQQPVAKVRMQRIEASPVAGGEHRQEIEIDVIRSEGADVKHAHDKEHTQVAQQIQELREKLVQAIRKDNDGEVKEVREKIFDLMQKGKHQISVESHAAQRPRKVEAIVIEEHVRGDVKERQERESAERREHEIQEQKEMVERRMHEMREREQHERETQLRERDMHHHEMNEPEQIMQKVLALHQAGERLENGGLHDLAHQLHRQAEEMEQQFHKMQQERERVQAAGRRPDKNGPHGTDPAVHHLAEQVDQLRHEVRELHRKLDRMMEMMERAHVR